MKPRQRAARRRIPVRAIATLLLLALVLLGWQFRGVGDFVAPAESIELTFSTHMATLSGSG